HKAVSWEPRQVLAAAERDLAKRFPGFSQAKVLRSKVVKEPFATLSPIPGSDARRPLPGSGLPGFHFAGDWTKAGLPATIEGAVIDPEAFDEKAFVDHKGPTCIVPPNSFALARTVERFKIPRDTLAVCLGKSTYARCGIIVNVTPLEPTWEGYLTLEISNTT